MNRRILPLSLILIGTAGCHQPGHQMAEPAPGPAQLFANMGSHHRTIRTQSSQAQQYFDQGLTWTFGFNHDEAIRCFHEVTRLDPTCAMGWWGVALANGPHINNPVMSEAQSHAAWAAVEKARALRSHADPTEQTLIDALIHRYAATPPKDRAPLDKAYSDAMRTVWKAHPQDADIGALFAESMMDLNPWKLYTREGNPQPGTAEIVAVLEAVQRIDPDHPGGNHYYIHAVEASRTPQRAMGAADRLRNAVPTSGHLTHMPSHIDVRTGRWAEASDANVRASAADRSYRERSPRQGFQKVYMAHNLHFLTYAAMMEGRSEIAIETARRMVHEVPPEKAREQAAFLDPVMGISNETLMRFGRWDEILKSPPPPSFLPITTALWHFSRGVSYAATNRLPEAASSQTAFRSTVKRIPKDAIFGNNTAHDVLSVAEHMLAGEIAFRRGSIDEAITELREAVRLEDRLGYDEPPDWIQPVRHTLGAVLLSAGRISDAEQVYRDDLARLPGNGWSLYGLSKCLTARGATDDARVVDERFKKAWARADMTIGSSCLCVKHGS